MLVAWLRIAWRNIRRNKFFALAGQAFRCRRRRTLFVCKPPGIQIDSAIEGRRCGRDLKVDTRENDSFDGLCVRAGQQLRPHLEGLKRSLIGGCLAGPDYGPAELAPVSMRE